jgi:hypothetical protein
MTPYPFVWQPLPPLAREYSRVCDRWDSSRIGGYLLYNTVNKAGANSSRVVREPLLAEAMAARRRDKIQWAVKNIVREFCKRLD